MALNLAQPTRVSMKVFQPAVCC